MNTKTNREFCFEVELNWLEGKKGILSSRDTSGTIHVGTPPQFGGEGKPWTPEHLFLGAISSCFMTTFLAFAQKNGLQISRMECEIRGQIELVTGRYKFTTINIFPKIFIPEESLREKANQTVARTEQYCLVANSVATAVYYHPQVLTGELSAEMAPDSINPVPTPAIKNVREINY